MFKRFVSEVKGSARGAEHSPKVVMTLKAAAVSCLLFILTYYTGTHTKVCATIRTKTFFRNVNPGTTSDHVSSPKSFSQLACAVRCLSASPNCTSYLHNPATGECIQALTPDILVPQMEKVPGDLYVTCDTLNGFHLHRYRSAAACISVFKSTRGNFTQAVSRCEALGGYLASVRTWDKLQLLVTAMGNSINFWVGLDDMEEEGTYVWRENGEIAFQANSTYSASEMAEMTMSGLWDHPREPNNLNDNEDCIQVKFSNTFNELRLNDFRCQTMSKYICEMRSQFV